MNRYGSTARASPQEREGRLHADPV